MAHIEYREVIGITRFRGVGGLGFRDLRVFQCRVLGLLVQSSVLWIVYGGLGFRVSGFSTLALRA